MADRVNVISFRDFVDPQQKDKDWILRAVEQHYYHGGAESLLAGKDVQEILNYASGKHDMSEFKAMFPDLPKKRSELAGNIIDKRLAVRMGIDFEPLGILQQPLAAALAVLQKQLTYVSYEAIDATANANRQKDMDIIKNRPLFEKAIQPLKEGMKMPLPPPQPVNNSPTVDISALDLNPMKEDELNLWADLFYKLRPETAFEVTIEALMYWNDFGLKTDLCKRDQVYFGVSASRTYISDMTSLPYMDYVAPKNVYCPKSELPDFSDVPFMYEEKRYNVEQLLNVVGQEQIEASFITGIYENYWKMNGYVHSRWTTAPESQKLAGVPVVYMEFKSFDVLRVERKRTRSGRMHVEVVPFAYKQNGKKNDPNDEIKHKWPQQTYFAYWIPGTDIILKSGKVLGTFRAKGRESISRFTFQIYKSKEKSDVELCIPLVKDAQRAYIKLQQAIIMAKPKGQYIDMKFLRNAAESLAEDMDLSVESLLALFAQHNVMIGDTEGMDGQNEGNFKPVMEIGGGMGGEVQEYLAIIQNARSEISKQTGYNDALTGQSPNPDALVGVQKLMLQSSMNSLYYAQKAIRHMTEQTLQSWTPMIQYICKKENRQTEARKALENIVGAKKIDVLNDMEDLPVHHFGLRVDDAPDEEAQAELRDLMLMLVRGGGMDFSDYFAVRRVKNYKDAQQLLIIKEKKRKTEARQAAKEANEAVVAAEQIRAKNKIDVVTVTAQGEIQEEAVKAKSSAELQQMKGQLMLALKQLDERIETRKKEIQGEQQTQKITTKHALELQKPL